jgi:hypothetical protein
MDWQNAINRHRKPLLHIVATLFAMIGLSGGAPVERVSRPLYLAVLRLLRPAESAVRRLIVVAARGLVVKPPEPRAAPAKPVTPGQRKGRKDRKPRRVAFRLFDPRQRFTAGWRHRRHPLPTETRRPLPRIHVIDVSFDPRVPLFRSAAFAPPPPLPAAAPEPDDTVSALRLSRRLLAIRSALEDLPRQALRYARWQARPADKRRPQLASALRPGRPPGKRKNPAHKVDEILNECDWLARHAARPDTS